MIKNKYKVLGKILQYLTHTHVQLTNGAKPLMENDHGYTPIHCAAMKGHVTILDLLMEHSLPPWNNITGKVQTTYTMYYITVYRQCT